MPVATLTYRCGAATTAGRRSMNQDAYSADGPWFVVADGVGGHASGEVAASIAVSMIGACSPPESTDDVATNVAAVHRAVMAEAELRDTPDMASTIVGVVPLSGRDELAVFHVGDSRCYRFADGTLSLMTRDHSLVEELIAAGRIDSNEAACHPNRHVISRALGIEGAAEAEVARVAMRGMRLLLCTDGVSNTLPPAAIGRVLAAVSDPQDAADRLVEFSASGDDNATALVLDVSLGPAAVNKVTRVSVEVGSCNVEQCR